MSRSAEPPTLLVELTDRVAKITLNRPQRINAIDDSIRTLLPQALQAADEDADISAIVLCGAGERGFCAGADIKEVRERLAPVGERRRLMPHTWIEALDAVSKPTIAVLHGICLGGGAELALACDIRIAARNVSIGLPETTLGLIPGGGGTQRLARLIGLGPALDLLLTGERMGVDRAYALGLVTRTAGTAQEALAEAMRIARLIADRPQAAIAYCKEAVRAGMQSDLQHGLRLEKSLFAILSSTPERAAAVAAFQAKSRNT